jgi:hypothetical protein
VQTQRVQQGAAATEILNRFCPPLYHHYCHYHHKIDRDPVVVDAEAIASLFFLAWKVRPHDDFPTDIDKVRRIFWYTLYCHCHQEVIGRILGMTLHTE